MNSIDIHSEILLGEDSQRQFKANVQHADQIAPEIIAFANASGGVLLIGVSDNGSVVGLSSSDIHRINQLLSNATSQNIRPSFNLRTQNLLVHDKVIIRVEIPEGLNKPYCDNEGRFWVKNGSDMRKVTSPEELQRLFQSGFKLFADERPVSDTTIDDVDLGAFSQFYHQKTGSLLETALMPLGKLMEALGLMRKGALTLAGLLLVGKDVSRHYPVFHISAVAVAGTELTDSHFIDKSSLCGKLSEQYNGAMSFLHRHLTHFKANSGLGFNQSGSLEIPQSALQEIIVNALIHRDYFVNVSVKIYIFSNRVEIHSPGTLPNSLTVESIKLGVSVPRNSILLSHGQYILPYSGLGSGLPRSLAQVPDLEFENDELGNRFIVRFPRVNRSPDI